MSITVREAKIDDIPILCALEAECFSSPWSENAFSESMSEEGSIFLLAELGGEAVGYAGGICVLDECSVTNVAVGAAYRQKGAGSSLMLALESEAYKRGARLMFLEVRVSNAPAISVYEKLGYEKCGTRRDFYSKPREDAYVYRKELVKQ